LVGRRFGDLTVIGRAPNRCRKDNGKPRAYWRCLCACGASVEIRTDHLRSVKSCRHCGTKQRGRAKARARSIAPHPKLSAKARADAFAESLRPFLEQAIADGCTVEALVARLNARGIRARRGGRWQPTSVRKLLGRIGLKTRPADAFAERLRPVLTQAVADGCSLRQIADLLDGQGIRTRRGGKWGARAVLYALERLRLTAQRRQRRLRAAAPAEHAEAHEADDFGDLFGDIGGAT
jgi:hypothetical protein